MVPSNSISTPVPFPQPAGIRDPNSSASPPGSPSNARRQRTSTIASTTSNRIRTASIKLMEANPPPGMWAATGSTASKAPSLADIRRGSFGSDGWNEETQRKRADTRTSQEERTRPSRTSSTVVTPLEGGSEPFPAVTEEDMREHPSNETVQHAPTYDAHDKHPNAGIELRQSNSTTDKTNSSAAREPMTESGQVRTASSLIELPITCNLVCEWLCPTAEASLEKVLCYRSEELLEVVSHTSRLSDHTVRVERCRMGWHAVPASL
jgi:hypothetical protein